MKSRSSTANEQGFFAALAGWIVPGGGGCWEEDWLYLRIKKWDNAGGRGGFRKRGGVKGGEENPSRKAQSQVFQKQNET